MFRLGTPFRTWLLTCTSERPVVQCSGGKFRSVDPARLSLSPRCYRVPARVCVCVCVCPRVRARVSDQSAGAPSSPYIRYCPANLQHLILLPAFPHRKDLRTAQIYESKIRTGDNIGDIAKFVFSLDATNRL